MLWTAIIQIQSVQVQLAETRGLCQIRITSGFDFNNIPFKSYDATLKGAKRCVATESDSIAPLDHHSIELPLKHDHHPIEFPLKPPYYIYHMETYHFGSTFQTTLLDVIVTLRIQQW